MQTLEKRTEEAQAEANESGRPQVVVVSLKTDEAGITTEGTDYQVMTQFAYDKKPKEQQDLLRVLATVNPK